MPTVLKCPKIAGANSLFFKIAGAKAPTAPVLNRPLHIRNEIRAVKAIPYNDEFSCLYIKQLRNDYKKSILLVHNLGKWLLIKY